MRQAKSLDSRFPRIRGEACEGVLSVTHSDEASVQMKGWVDIEVWRGAAGTGKLVTTIHDHNLVVTAARRIVSRLISGAVVDSLLNPATISYGTPTPVLVPIINVNELFIDNMRWGTGGEDPLTPTIPIDPLPTDEELYEPIPSPAQKSVIVDYTDTTTVRFTATLEQSEANGYGLSEVGLFTNAHNFLFARKTFGVLTKSSDFSFIFRWSCVF